LAFLSFKFKGYSEVGAKHIVKYEYHDKNQRNSIFSFFSHTKIIIQFLD